MNDPETERIGRTGPASQWPEPDPRKSWPAQPPNIPATPLNTPMRGVLPRGPGSGPSKPAAFYKEPKLIPTDSERYLYEIRNWARFFGILAIVSLIAALIVGVMIVHAVDNANSTGTGSTSSLCQSQGGPIQGC